MNSSVNKKMSTTSSTKLKTLQGIFEPPKIVYRRDFVRENKLNLKTKSSSGSASSRGKSPSIIGSKEQLGNNGLQSRATRTSRLAAGATTADTSSVAGCLGMSRLPPTRSLSMKSLKNSTIGNTQRCPSCSSHANGVQRLAAEDLCDKQSQTEDIKDEEFLYHALKKCVGPEPADRNLASYDSGETNRNNGGDNEQRHSYSHYTQKDEPYDHFQQHDHNYLDGNRSVMSNSHNQAGCDDNSVHSHHSKQAPYHTPVAHFSEKQNQVDREAAGEQVDEAFDRLSLKPNHAEQDVAMLYKRSADQMSVASRASQRQNGGQFDQSDQMSVHSRSSVHSKAGSHKLGSRDNLILPAYLEREKREKQEEYLREISRDPNCPVGYTALTDDERLQELREAEKQFNLLVSELNHMPMTSETLRARRRKQEIEKQLNTVENKIRLYSKANVYVPEEQDDKQQPQLLE